MSGRKFRLIFLILIISAFLGNSSVPGKDIFIPKKETFHEDAIRHAREGNFEKALELIQKALDETGETPEIISDYIVILAWAGRCKKAVKLYEALPAPYAPPDYLLVEIAGCYRLINEYGKAISIYQEYLKRKPDDENAVRGLILAFLDAGELDAARQYIKEHSREGKERTELVEVYSADILVREGKLKQAEKIYTTVLEKNSDNLYALTGLSRILVGTKKYDRAEIIIDKILENDPGNLEALFWKGEVLENQKEYMAACKIYEKVLIFYPDNQAARNLKCRVLMDMNANSLAMEEAEHSKDRIDARVLQMLWGNEAMVRIWWKEPGIALDILDRNKTYAESPPNQEFPPLSYPAKFLLRTDYDRVLALRQKEEMETVIGEYERLKEMGLELPYWILEKTGDAYLYLQYPEESLVFYRESLRKQLDSFGKPKAESNTMMSIYHNLIEWGVTSGHCRNFRESGDILEQLDKEMPVRVIERGVLQDNWSKADVAYNNGWFLLYQGRMAEAQEYLDRLHSRGPFNTHIRTALAHAYLWRGWPRLALEEFEIIRTMDPKNIAGTNGYYYALDQNNRGEEARELAKELLKKYPANKHVQQTNRHFAIQDMHTFTFDSTYNWEYPGVRETFYSARLDQPLAPWRKLFAQVLWHDISGKGTRENIWRAYLGADWRRNRDWWLTGSISADKEGDNIGAAGEITCNPNDYLSFEVLYDSYSLSIPLQALAAGIESKEWALTTLYRQSESFMIEGKANFLRMSDDNDRDAYSVRINRALTANTCWKTHIELEGYTQNNSRTDVPYFSPENIYSVYLAPSVRHTWYHRYNKRFVDNLVVGIGRQKQKNFSEADVWYAKYAWDCSLSDTLAFVAGATYSRRNYDGGDVDVWGYYLTVKKNF